MKISKKLLSVLLAVVMIVSVFSLGASAYVPELGTSASGKVNIRLTVEEVDTITDGINGGTYTGDDIYAVKVYVQCDYALPYIYFPVHYNKTHFNVVTAIVDNGDGTSSMYYGDETFNSDMSGDTTMYMYDQGDFMQYTGNYNANGVSVTAALQQKCYGLGSSKATGYAEEIKSIDTTHSEYANWVGNLDSNTGIVKLGFDSFTTKHAYMNTVISSDTGITTTKDEVRYITLYFQRVNGVSADDVINDVFGSYDVNSGIYDAFLDATGPYYTEPDITSLPVEMTYTNATIEAPSFMIEHVATQIQWANEDMNAVNLGFKGQFKAADIGITWADGERDSNNVSAVGVELEDGTQYTEDTVYTPDDGVTYQFRAVVTGIPEANYSTNITLRYFVVLDGETIYSDWVTDNAAAHTSRLPA